MFYKGSIIFLLISIITTDLLGQKPLAVGLQGTPQVLHYSRYDFNADPQFWSVTEDRNGILYFGNNDGTVIFDGERWHKVALPNNSSVRCLTTDSAGNVYAGGFNEFGLIKKDNTGRFYYQSLLDSLKFHDDNIENLWQVHVVQEIVIFRSFSNLIAINGKKVTKLPANQNFIRSFKVDNQYFVQDQDHGIFKLDVQTFEFTPYFSQKQLEEEDIIAILPTKSNEKVLGIASSGKILQLNFKNKQVQIQKELFAIDEVNKVESAIASNDSVYYLGTLSSGIVKINRHGEILQEDRSFKNLQDKSVLNLYETEHGNIWALLNNGLSCITYNSPVSILFEGASLYDVYIEGNEAYLATNQGVYYTKNIHESKPYYKKVKGLEGQGWTVQEVAGEILVGHDKGLFIVNKTESTPIGNVSGIWKVKKVKEKKNIYLAAGYRGLYVIQKINGKWQLSHQVEGFGESTRDILESEDPGTFWVCHGYKGVYRIKINDDYTKVTSLEHFTTQNGFVSPYSINVFNWNDQTVFNTNHGIYTYQKAENQFVPFSTLNNILDSTKNTRKLLQHQDKTWFVHDDEVGYFTEQNRELQKGLFLQFKGAFNRGMEYIKPLDSNKVMLGTKTGLYLFDLSYNGKVDKATTNITSVRYITKNDESWLTLDPEHPIKLPNNTYSLKICFASPKLQTGSDIQYSYQLGNIDTEWSAWQSIPSKEYSHLRPGQYDFKVKSRSLVGSKADMASISFEILPLWYQTKWMFAIYILTGLFIIMLAIKLVKKKIAKESRKTREQEQKSKKLLELELEQFKLKAEKQQITQDKLMLQENVINKSKELANYTMMLVKKKDIFEDIRKDIIELRGLVRNDNSRRKIQKMFSKLNQHVIGEEYLQIFDTNFEQVHHDFFKNLKALYPDLTQRELRLCAFVKMNLTNKEISPLLNISVRGVETARYRIRKKMDIDHDDNFGDFLESICLEKEGY